MKFNSIEEWAKARIGSRPFELTGVNSKTQKYLEDNYAQIALSEYASFVRQVFRPLTMSIVHCLNEEGYKFGFEEVLKSGKKTKYFPESIDPAVIQRIRVCIAEHEVLLASLKYHVEVLEELCKLQDDNV